MPTPTRKRETVEFPENTPVTLVLEYAHPKPCQGKTGPRFMYSVHPGKVMFLDPDVAGQIDQMNIVKGEPFTITNTKGGMRVARLGDRPSVGQLPDGTYAVPAATHARPATPARRPPASETGLTLPGYIGSASNISRRWIYHRNALKNGTHTNPHLQRAWNKYSRKAFSFTVLEYAPIANLREREQFWIDTTHACVAGYNIVPDSKHKILAPETIEKLRKVRTGKPLSQPHRRAISVGNKGKSYSLRTRALISLKLLGVQASEEEIQKRIEILSMRKSVPRGSRTPEEARRAISNALAGHSVSEETRRKISHAKTGKPVLSRRKITAEQESALIARHSAGENFCELGRAFGISRVAVRVIVRGRSYQRKNRNDIGVAS